MPPPPSHPLPSTGHRVKEGRCSSLPPPTPSQPPTSQPPTSLHPSISRPSLPASKPPPCPPPHPCHNPPHPSSRTFLSTSLPHSPNNPSVHNSDYNAVPVSPFLCNPLPVHYSPFGHLPVPYSTFDPPPVPHSSSNPLFGPIHPHPLLTPGQLSLR